MNIGMILLGIYLIAMGAATFIPQLTASPMNIVLGVLAIVAGILTIAGR